MATDPIASSGRTQVSRVRVFFALWPEAATASALNELGWRAAPATARRMRRDTLHLTLAFVGDIEARRLPRLAAVGDSIDWPRFSLRLDQLGCWSHNHILWLGPRHTPEPLSALVDALARGLRQAGFALAERAFTPHITLARKVIDPQWQAPVFNALDWQVNGGVLVCSERTAAGASYRPLAQWPA